MEDELLSLANEMNFMAERRSNGIVIRIPCMGLALILERVDDDRVFPYIHCKKAPGAWSGGASDIIDITTYMAAAYMSGQGKSSYQLLDYDHPVAASELGERYLIPRQPVNLTVGRDPESMKKVLEDLWWFGQTMHIALPQYCPTYSDSSDSLAAPSEEAIDWARGLGAALPKLFNPGVDLFTSRGNPYNLYYRTHDGEVSITRDPEVADALNVLKDEAKIIPGPKGEIRENAELLTAISYKEADKAVRIMEAAGEEIDDREDLQIFSFENALLCVRGETIVLLGGTGGRQAYQEERQRIVSQHQLVSSTLLAPDAYTWAPRIDGQVFEDMVRELLEADPFVTEVRSAGPAKERDGGRDLLIKQLVPQPGGTNWSAEPKNLVEIPVVVQCKALASTVGIGDVREIRDVIEDAGAQGFLLVTSSRVSSALTSRLGLIRDKNGFHTDWWDRHQLEVLLRRNPDIVRRYSSIVMSN